MNCEVITNTTLAIKQLNTVIADSPCIWLVFSTIKWLMSYYEYNDIQMRMLCYVYRYNILVALILKEVSLDSFLTNAIVCNILILLQFGISCFTTDKRSSFRDQRHDSPSNWKGQTGGWAGSSWKGHVEDEDWRDQ